MFIATEDEDFQIAGTVSAMVVSYTFVGLSPDTTYSLVVDVVCSDGFGSSSTLHATTLPANNIKLGMYALHWTVSVQDSQLLFFLFVCIHVLL